MTRLIRKFAACLGIAALLIMQIAASAFSCPMQTSGPPTFAIDSESEPIYGPDEMSLDPLCGYHCQQGNQSLDKPDVPAVPHLAATGYTDAVTIGYLASSPVPSTPPRSLLARSSDPPLIIRNCCLRI